MISPLNFTAPHPSPRKNGHVEMIAPWFRPPHVFDKPAQRSDRSFADHCPAPFTHVMQHVGGVHTVPRPAPPAEPAPAGPSRRSGRRVLHLERRTFYRFPVIVRLRARRAPFRTQDHGVRVRIGVNHDPRAGGVPAFYPGHDDVTGFRIRPTDTRLDSFCFRFCPLCTRIRNQR